MKKFLPIFLSLFLPLFALSASADAPSADALRAEADALAADIAARLGSSVRPGTPFPGVLPPDALADAACDASALADDLEARWPDILLSDFHCTLSENLANPAPAPDDTPADVWAQTLRLAAIRRLDTTADAIRASFALPPGPERAAALPPDFTFDPEWPVPEFLAKLTVHSAWRTTFITLALARDNTAAALAAAALLRYHRDTGALPDTLDALVPDYLPALPLAFTDGAPLSYTPWSDDDIAGPGFTLSFPGSNSAVFFPLPAAP